MRQFRPMAIGMASLAVAFAAMAADSWVATVDPLNGVTCAEGARSADARLDNRALSRTVHALVHGTEMKSESPETPAAVWDTTQESEGWHTYTASSNEVKVLVRNDPSIAVEGGRLQSDVTWTADKVHIVRHKVLVPSGYRLTVEEGAVVKFGEGTGIEVLSGGKLTLSGRPDKRTCLTSIADDIFGGDTDCLATNAVYGTWSISSSDSTALDSYYTHIRFGTVSVLPTVGMAASYTTGLRSEGKVRINVSVSGSRSNRFSLHWRIKEGTAKFGEDYLQSEGEVEWPNTTDSAYWFEIPIAEKTSSDEIKHFTVEIFSTEDCNVNSGSLRTEVAITPKTDLPAAISAESAISETIRLENRSEGTTGKALSHGTEWKSANGESRAVTWNTTAESDGWKEFFDGSNSVKTLVRNDASIAVEGGRLQSNETWTASQTHLVRNRVIVPSGVTLTVTTNAVIKFCENTGITVNLGGQLIVLAATNAPAIFTSVADDTVGGDTDMKEATAVNDQYTISVSGTYSSTAGAVFRYTTFSSLPTISVPSGAEVSESDEIVRIPVSVSGSRTTPFLLRWRTINDTAEYGTDFTVNSGVIEWSSSSDAAKTITIPIANDGIAEESEKFIVELYDAQDANVSRSAYRCTVIVRDSTQTNVPVAISAESEISASIRLENRAEGMLGKALAHEKEWKSADGETRAELWDTTQEEDGWKTFGEGSNAVQVLVRNDPSIAVEGGRMQSNETWTASQTHLVRNRVIVPSGVTLTVVTNTVVKFCENTGITVNSGGQLIVVGSTNEPAVFASVADDTVGGDTDMREVAPADGFYTISMSGSYSSPAGAVFRHTTFSTLPTVSITSGVEVNESDEQVKVAISVSGSRTAPFRLFWRAINDSAEYGSDYTLKEGVIDWGTSSDSTKYIIIPIANDGEPEESEKFVIELYEAQNANVSRSAYRCTVTVRDSTPTEIPVAISAESEISAPIRLENRAEGTLAKALVHGAEWKSADGVTRAVLWDTTQEEDGWKTFGEGSNAVQVLVRNDPSIAIEGGRLLSDETWTASQTHLVRNWVIVPSGVTLTITTNAVVKFCEKTGIQVNSGGRLNFLGADGENIYLTTAADDTVAGDTDLRVVSPSNGWYSISNSGTMTDAGMVTRYYSHSSFPNVTATADAVVDAADGIVRLPIFVSGSRSTTFSVDWTTSLGESGRIVWNNASEGTKWVTFPVSHETPDFTFNLVEGRGCNIATPKVTRVDIYSNAVDRVVCTGSEISAPVRLETRDIETSYAAPLVTGVQQISGEDGSGHVDWNTTDTADGWQAVNCGGLDATLWVVNDASIAVEGGRVLSSMTWTPDRVHLVRHWVIVPSGVTLTIAAGTVVKFCDQTGIKVESGGKLICDGTAVADVILTSVHDDTAGGDTDGKEIAPKTGYYSISSSGTFTDTYTAMRYGTSGTFGSASIASQIIGKKQSGHVRIPVTISTSRSTAFAVDWVAIDGTAKFGEDYLCASGRVEWASSSAGTKYIDIPLERMAETSPDESFTVRLTYGRGINLSTTTCTVKLYDTVDDVLTGNHVGFSASDWADVVPVDTAAGNEPLFVFGEVPVRYSTQWATNGARVRVTSTDVDDARSTLYLSDTVAEGWYPWQCESYADGRYDLAHVVADVVGAVVASNSAVFIVNRDVRVHGGNLNADETWSKDYVHYVRSTVTVQPGVTLTIEPGAVVKFRSGAGIVVASGGTAVGRGAIFTHASDDTVGGDTFFDGQDLEPQDGKYTLSGNWILDVATQRRYQSAVTVGGTISTNTHWTGHQTYKVTSSLVVAAGATLEIDPGAVIKVASTSANVISITVNSNATLTATGTADAPVIFTTIKDDIHGDTNGDGTNTVAVAGDWPRIYANGTVNLERCWLRYCNNTGGRGVIEGVCGTVTFNNSVIEKSNADCVKMSGGSFAAHNSVFRDSAAAFGDTTGAVITVNNCLVTRCPIACRGNGKMFNNTVFINCEAFFETGDNVCAGCVFYNPEGFGAREDAVPDGGIWADPLLTDYENDDYSLTEDSPCIDAGVSVFTTTLLDFIGNDRVVNGVIDIGPCEYDSHVNTRSMVRFDLGLYGMRTGGGDLVQTITNGCAAVAPTFSVAEGWSFVDWDSDFSCVTNNMTVTAQWARVPKTVTVETTRGVAPQGGTNTVFWGDTFSVYAPEPVVCGTTQYVCRGAADYQPLATNYDIRVTNDITVVWNVWATNYWLAIEGATDGVGEITGSTNGWKAAGSTVSLVAKPVNGVFFMGWTGDTNGCEVAGTSIAVTMDRPRTVRAVFARLSVDLTSAIETVPYSGRIRVEGRDVALNCNIGDVQKTNAYLVQRDATTFVSSGGTAQGLTQDDQAGSYSLPFAFPFYGKTYTRVYPNSNGAIFLDAGNNAHIYSDDTFLNHPMIAGLWKDLKGGEVYVTQTSESVTFRWSSTYYSGGGSVRFSVTLYKTGEIKCAYGSGNANGGVIGISAGDGKNRLLHYNGSGSYGGAQDVRFIPCGVLPDWLTLTSNGVVSGTPTVAGTYQFYVYVTDDDGHATYLPVTIVVEENANKRPVVQGRIPSAATTHVFAGTNATFAVAATDPNGDALSYIWTLDGVEQKTVTASNYVFTANFATHGSHTLACAVTDGLWTIDAGSWRIESNCSLYVDAENGDDVRTGASETLAKRTLQSVVNAAIDGDSIFAAAGTYGHVTTSNKAVRIEGVKGHEQTFIDGGGTNRCIWVGSGNEFTNTAFVGFTICNGYAQGGAGSVGGTFDYCIFRNCDASRPGDDGSANWAGGAANLAVMRNCLVTGCHAPRGGATYGATLVNCTIVGNSASNHGGGTSEGTAVNCIIVDNEAPTGTNYYNGTLTYTCTDPLPSGTGNVNVNPYFTDAEGGDFRLRQYSPCLDVGNNAAVVGGYDLSGANRIDNGRVDLGAYEGWVYLPVPPDVGGLEAEVDRRIGIVRLKWAEEAFARSYKIFRAPVNDVESVEEIGTTTDCFFDDETAGPETDYWYWVAAANPTGIGPKGTSVKGRCLGTMTFGGSELAAGTVGLSYRTQLEVSGGSGKYTWASGADDYDIIRGESTFMMDIDDPTGELFGDDVCKSYPLPFDFPFYGKTYNKLWISSNGTLSFDGEFKSYSPSVDALKGRVMIAPFWKDLLQGNGGVYVSENVDESVTFIWYECAYYSGNTRVNASATLFADGTVLCSYGEGNANGAFVGISAGDGERYRYYDWLNKSLHNADDVIFAPQDVPAGLTLDVDGTLSGKPTAPGKYVFTVFVLDDLGNGATQQITLEIAENPDLRSVEFDLGEKGIRGGGGELVQYLMLGDSAVPPSVRVRAGWVFDGWVGSYSNITDNTVVTAKYRTSYPDLHVDSVDIPGTVAAGQQLQVAWTVGNTGNPSFTGTMNERIVLVSIADSNDVRVATTAKFEGSIPRDGSVERSATVAIPLKGWDGLWRVRIETAVSPSVKEAGGDNTRVADQVLVITPVPLPDLIAEAVSGNEAIVPGESFAVSYREKNVGASDAVASWNDVVYLESVDTGASVRLGNVVQAETLASGGTRSCASTFTVPDLINIAGRVRVRVEVDCDESVVESVEGDNVVYGETILSLGTNLYLSAASDSVKENVSSGVRFTVKRSGPTTEPMIIELSSDRTGQVTMPATVTIPAGNASTIFYVKPIDNAVVDGSRTVVISAQAGACRPATLGLTVTDNEVPKLTILLDKNAIKEGEGKIIATVTRELVTDEPLTVYLSGVSTSRCSYPSSVVIPAGEASVTFEVVPVNDETARRTEDLTLRASTSGYTASSVSYRMEDDDIPGVTLSLTPEEVSEGAGPQAIIATLTRSDLKQIKQPITILLSASESGQLILPSSITIPALTMATRFAIGVVDNGLDDGDREVEITGAVRIESCGCGGQPSNGDVIQGVVRINDNDGPSLSLRADPSTMKEGRENAGWLVLSHNSTLTENLVVRLSYDVEGEIDIPREVTIPAGENSVRIQVKTPNDGIEDGGQLVSVYADDVDGVFASGSTWIQVSDQNLPDLIVENVETSAPSVVGGSAFEVSFDVVNAGFNSRSAPSPYKVYFVTGTSVSLGDAKVVANGSTVGGLSVEGRETITVSVTAPSTPGNYRLAVVADPDAVVAELDEANNTAWSGSVTVDPSYTAWVEARQSIYRPGERVYLDGVATMADGTTPAGNVPVEVYVLNSSYRRVYNVITDSEGCFTAEFLPVSGEGDHYTVGASYPGISATATHCSFDILGLKRTSTSYVEFDLTVGQSKRVNVQIKNQSSIPFTKVSVSHGELPEDFGLEVSVPETIQAYGNANVSIDVSALVATPADVDGYRKVMVHVTDDEGVSLSFPIYVIVRNPKVVNPDPETPAPYVPQVRLAFTPSRLDRKMTVGESQYVDIQLTNRGTDPSGAITVNVPTATWLKLMNAKQLPSLEPGASHTITLELSPRAGMALNAAITGSIQAKEAMTGANVLLPFSFTPVSDSTGRIRVSPVDEYTYYQAGAPHVSNATVQVSNPYTGVIVARGVTDETGIWTSEDLPCGTYAVSVSATRHSGWNAKLAVEPGETTAVDPFLTYNAVTYSWDVKPVEIEETYEIRLVADFVTSVPKPTVVLEVPKEIPKLNEGESYTFNITAVNHGLISALNVRFAFPTDFPYSYEFASEVLESIPAKSSVTVPVKVYVPKSAPPKLMDAKPRLMGTGDVSVPGGPNGEELAYNPCSYGIMAMFEYLCGSDIREEVARSAALQVAGLACDAAVTAIQHLSERFPILNGFGGGDPVPGSGSGSGGGGGGGNQITDDWIDRINELQPYSQDFIKTNCVMGLKLLNCLSEQLLSAFPFVGTLGTITAKERYGYGTDEDVRNAALQDALGIVTGFLGTLSELANNELTSATIDDLQHQLEALQEDSACEDAVNYYFDVYRRVEEKELARRRAERENAANRSPQRLLGAAVGVQEGTQEELNSLCPPEVQEDAALSCAGVIAAKSILEKSRYVLGGGTDWENDASVVIFCAAVDEAIDHARNRTGQTDGRLTPLGDAEAEQLRIYAEILPGVRGDAVDAFVTRWNRTVAYYGDGKFSVADLEEGDNQDFIDLDVLNTYQKRIGECQEISDFFDCPDLGEGSWNAVCRVRSYLNEKSGEVCARVKFVFNQTICIAREAFRGTLTIYNGNESVAMRNVRLSVRITDANGDYCNDLFGITEEGTSGFGGTSAFAGDMTLGARATGSADILFVPTVDAAPMEPKLYYFGGTLTYIDPLSGEATSVPLSAVPLLVNPCPRLTMHYFLQQEVFGDDPFTADIVEPSEPAELALLVVNSGAGAVRNMTVRAAQPEKFTNEKGLAFDFRLSDFEVAGTAVNGVAGGGILTTDLGTIPANGTGQAQWWLTSSLQGRFSGMRAEFTQLNDWGNPKTCLIDSTKLHPLVRSVDADGNGKPDYLVCEEISDGMADTLYCDDGIVLDVNAATIQTQGFARGRSFDAILTFAADRSGAWYGVADDPGAGRYELVKVVREDGTELSPRNAWLRNRSITEKGAPDYGNKLHLFDVVAGMGVQKYVATFEAKNTNVPAIAAFDGIVNAAIETDVRDSVTVVFSTPIDPASFTVADLTLVKQGQLVDDLSNLEITALDETGRRFRISGLRSYCSDFARYELTVKCEAIADPYGNAGYEGRSVAWILASEENPYIVDAEGVPVRRVSAFDSFTLVTSSAVTLESLASASMTLNGREITASIRAEESDQSGTRFVVSGLGELQNADGDYELSVDGTGLRTPEGVAGVEVFRVAWTRDTVAPQLISIGREIGIDGQVFNVVLSEDADPATITIDNFILSRCAEPVRTGVKKFMTAGEERIELPSSARLTSLGNGVYSITGLDSVALADGYYTLAFDLSGVADEAGNVSTGSKSVSWTVDTTPPGQPTELAVSSDHGSVDEVVYSCEGVLTVSGKAAERGVKVQVISRAIGGVETVLATPAVASDGTFSADVGLPTSGGNVTIVVRQTDATGNSSDREIRVYYDKIALTANLSREAREGEVTREVVLTFSDSVDAGDVTLAKFALTRDGDQVTLDGAKLTASTDGKTFVLSGLEKFCSMDGDYVLTFAAEDVGKKTSGLKASDCAPLTWHYECPDGEPPVVTAIKMNDEDARGLYTNGVASVAVRFSEPVNVPELIDNGLVALAVKMQCLDGTGVVTGNLNAAVTELEWNPGDCELTWNLAGRMLGQGGYRVAIDAGLVADLAGNRLSFGEWTSDNLSQGFDFTYDAIAQVNAYAMPTWYDYDGDGLGDMIVGEKTSANEGKIRVYRNVGTATMPQFDDWSYLKVGGSDLIVPAQGCQGAQVCFADLNDDGHDDLIVGCADGKVIVWDGMATEGAYGEPTVIRTGTEVDYGSERAFVCAFDVDGDHDLELVVGGMDGKFRLLKKSAADTYVESWLTDAAGVPLKVSAGRSTPVLADINNDGVADILTGDTDGNVWAYLGIGSAWNVSPVALFSNVEKRSDRSRIGFADVNRDGYGDLLVGRSDGAVEFVLGCERKSPSHAFAIVATHMVTFDLGEFGTLASGELVQTVVDGEAAVAPTIEVDDDYVFDGWDAAFDSVTGDLVVHARYAPKMRRVKVGGGREVTEPAAGIYDYAYGSMVTVTVVNAIQCSGSTQYVCKGWTASNAEPTTGTGVQAVFKVVGDVEIGWQWETNVLSLAEAVNAGNLEWTTGGAKAWSSLWSDMSADGAHMANVVDVANNTNAYLSTTVEGAGTLSFAWCSRLASRNTKLQLIVDGEVVRMLTGTNDWTDASLTLLGDCEHALKWRLFTGRSGATADDFAALDKVAWVPKTPPTLAEALNTNLVWTTGGDIPWKGVAKESLLEKREAWAEVNGLGDDEVSVIETRVYGSGVLTFDWSVSCEMEYDWLQLVVDGEVRGYIDGQTDWTKHSLTISGTEWHVVRWEYVKDEMDDLDLVGDNKAMLDNVVWASTDIPPTKFETETTPVPVPYSVLEGEGFKSYLDAANGDYEAAAFMMGKNGYPLWQSYVAGLDPNKEDSKFKVDIKIENDKVIITWNPDLNKNNTKHVRDYHTFGRKQLGGTEGWVDMKTVPEAEKGDYRFFKVTVEMPK